MSREVYTFLSFCDVNFPPSVSVLRMPFDPAISLLCIYPKEIRSKRPGPSDVYRSIIHNSQDRETT